MSVLPMLAIVRMANFAWLRVENVGSTADTIHPEWATRRVGQHPVLTIAARPVAHICKMSRRIFEQISVG